MELLCIVLLSYVALACLAGAFSQCYAATVLQRIGMALIAVWAVWRVFLIVEQDYVHPHMALGAFGMATFAAGTMLKTWLWRLKDETRT